jgi:ABC-type multidrug transport system ATPase subunit
MIDPANGFRIAKGTHLNHPPTLAIQNLVKKYNQRVALAGVDLTIEAGAWNALVGPNGAGKTTLLRSVIGLVNPDEGTIEFEGQQIRPSIRRSSMGYAPQDNALYETLTTREHLEYFSKLLGLDRATRRTRVQEALDFAQLVDRANDQVQGLSGGMKRRLNIACAVLNRPRLLLLDEPTTGVDPVSRAAIWEMLRRLREGGTAILHATHRLDEVEFLCDAATILGNGRILYEGSLDDLRHAAGLPTYVLQHPETNTDKSDGALQTVNVPTTPDLPAAIEKLRAAGVDPATIRVRPTSFETVFQELVAGKADS